MKKRDSSDPTLEEIRKLGSILLSILEKLEKIERNLTPLAKRTCPYPVCPLDSPPASIKYYVDVVPPLQNPSTCNGTWFG